MSGASKKLMGTTAAGAEFLAIEDVFSTYLYTGNGSTQTITNGIDLAGEGGLVWIKSRSDAFSNTLTDTDRGGNNHLFSDSTSAQQSFTGLSFNSNGFDINSAGSNFNFSNSTYASWTFRKAPRFFDVVTYTGDGVAGRQIAHNLGTDVGSIFVKKTSGADAWAVWHRGANGGNAVLVLNSTAAQNTNGRFWWGDNTSYIAPTSTEFTVATDGQVNASGETYVAYLFAHDPLGPSGDGSDGLIACGSFTTDGSGNVGSVELGWEPQWILVKDINDTQNWMLFDTMRGFGQTSQFALYPNLSSAETQFGGLPYFHPTATGFSGTGNFFGANATLIYIAIRRGPMRQPTSGTEVFAVDNNPVNATSSQPAYTSGWPVDFGIRNRTTGSNHIAVTRLLGDGFLVTDTANAESGASGNTNISGYQDGFYSYNLESTVSGLAWMFRRAPGFFDVVAYTGDGVDNRQVPHNLGVVPELFIHKSRSAVGDWRVYSAATYGDDGADGLTLNTSDEANQSNSLTFPQAPTDTHFIVDQFAAVNNPGDNYIVYLFATLPGISKVGSYTGNGSSQTINCGFTSGARFVLIKRTDSTGNWYVWDTARGIVAANDPHLSLNSTAAEVTTDDSIDPDSSGFIVNQVAATNINVNAASYIFLAIA